MTRNRLKPLMLLSATALMLVAGCASVEAPATRAGREVAKAPAEMEYPYTGSRIPSRYATNHVVQVNGADYQRSLPSNPGTPLMATGANGPSGAR